MLYDKMCLEIWGPDVRWFWVWICHWYAQPFSILLFGMSLSW